MAKISIIGAGSWGTALGLLLCNNGHDVTICSENEKEIESLKEHREHLTKLPGVKLPDEMKFPSGQKPQAECSATAPVEKIWRPVIFQHRKKPQKSWIV